MSCQQKLALTAEWNHRIPGHLVESVNPDISTQKAGNPYYLFDSQSLQAIGSILFERLTLEDSKSIPETKQSLCFPYRESTGSFALLNGLVYNTNQSL